MSIKELLILYLKRFLGIKEEYILMDTNGYLAIYDTITGILEFTINEDETCTLDISHLNPSSTKKLLLQRYICLGRL